MPASAVSGKLSDGTRTRDRLDHNTVRHFGGVRLIRRNALYYAPRPISGALIPVASWVFSYHPVVTPADPGARPGTVESALPPRRRADEHALARFPCKPATKKSGTPRGERAGY